MRMSIITVLISNPKFHQVANRIRSIEIHDDTVIRSVQFTIIGGGSQQFLSAQLLSGHCLWYSE